MNKSTKVNLSMHQTVMIKLQNSSKNSNRKSRLLCLTFANSNMMVVLCGRWLFISVHHIISCWLNIFIFLFDLLVSWLDNIPKIIAKCVYHSQNNGVNYNQNAKTLTMSTSKMIWYQFTTHRQSNYDKNWQDSPKLKLRYKSNLSYVVCIKGKNKCKWAWLVI